MSANGQAAETKWSVRYGSIAASQGQNPAWSSSAAVPCHEESFDLSKNERKTGAGERPQTPNSGRKLAHRLLLNCHLSTRNLTFQEYLPDRDLGPAGHAYPWRL